MTLKIGNIRLENPLVLAPMAGVNCLAFRIMCRRYGAALVYSPMIEVDLFLAEYKKDKENAIKRFLHTHKAEQPIAMQLVGNNPEQMAQTAEIVQEHCQIIDINLGCIEGDILGKKAGAYFVKHPEHIAKLIKPIKESISIPLTAKIRTGWDERSVNAVEVSQILEANGVDAIAVHGRTRKQKYTGQADWGIIKNVVDNTSVPIIGNGDVFKPGTAKAMLDRTKCDFVMIGRGAKGDPSIFKRSADLLNKGKAPDEPTSAARRKMFKEFLQLYEKHENKIRIGELRHHALWFLKGNRRLKQKILDVKNIEELKKII